MSTLAETRTAFAAALSTVTGVDVRPYTVKTPKVGDGWVTFGRLAPDGFRTGMATLTAFVVLGSDEQLAEQKADALAGPLMAATDGIGGDVLVESVSVVAGTNAAPMYALTVTLTAEVEQ